MYKGNKEREARQNKKEKSEVIQKNDNLNNDTTNIPKLSEINGFENTAFRFDENTNDIESTDIKLSDR